MAFFTSIATGLGFASGSIGAGLVVGGLQLATGLAFNALSSALFSPDAQDLQNAAIERQLRQGVVSRSFIVGRYATAGSFVFHASCALSSTPSDDPNEEYVAVYALSDMPVRGLNRMWVDGKEVTLGAGTSGKTARYGYDRIPELDDDGQAKGWYRFYDGTQTEADELLYTDATTSDWPWTTQHVGRGVAYVAVCFDYDPDIYSGFPEVFFEVDGIPIRETDGTISGPDNRHHDLAAAQIYEILGGISYAGQWLYGPQVQGTRDPSHWEGAIQSCRIRVPGADKWSESERLDAFGSTTPPPRYMAGLEVNVSRPIADTIEDLASACNGRFSEVAGAWRFQVGDPPTTADFSFTDEDILITEAQSFSPFFPLAETVNGISAVYPDPEQQYEDQEPKPRYVPAYEAEDGNRRLVTTARLDAVPYKEQVQRLMKSSLDEARRARRHTIVMPPKFWAVEPGDYARWSSERNGYIGKLFRVDGVQDRANGDVALDLTEVDPTDYDFDAEDFQAVPSGSLVQPDVPVFAAIDFAVAASFVSGAGGAKRPAIQLTWGTERSAQGIQYRVYLAGTSNEVSSGVTMDYRSGAGGLPISAGILSLTDYEVQARRIMRRGRAEWSARLPVTTGDYRLGPSDLSAELQAVIDEATGEGQTALEKANAIIDAIDPDSGMTQAEASDAGVAALRLFSGDVLDFKANFAGLTAQTVDGNIAGFQAVSWDDPDGGGSSLKLIGNEVLIPGSVYMSDLTVTDLNNLIPDGNLAGGTLDPWKSTTGNVFVRERGTGGSGAVLNAPTKWIFASENGGQDEIATVTLTEDQRIPVRPGEQIRIKADYAGGGSNISRDIKIRASVVDATGASVGTMAPQVTATSTSWSELSSDATVPPGGSYISQWQVHFYAGSGAGFVSYPTAYRMNAGELVVDGGFTAAKANVGSWSAAGLSVFGGHLRSNNYNGSDGWIIRQNGSAEFKNLVARDWIKIGAVDARRIGEDEVSDYVTFSRFENNGSDASGRVSINAPESGMKLLIWSIIELSTGPEASGESIDCDGSIKVNGGVIHARSLFGSFGSSNSVNDFDISVITTRAGQNDFDWTINTSGNSSAFVKVAALLMKR